MYTSQGGVQYGLALQTQWGSCIFRPFFPQHLPLCGRIAQNFGAMTREKHVRSKTDAQPQRHAHPWPPTQIWQCLYLMDQVIYTDGNPDICRFQWFIQHPLCTACTAVPFAAVAAVAIHTILAPIRFAGILARSSTVSRMPNRSPRKCLAQSFLGLRLIHVFAFC